MPKKLGNGSTPPVAQPDDEEQASGPGDLDLSDVADRLDNDARSRAVERILSHHQALRREIDQSCKRLGDLSEEVSALAARIAVLEEDEEEQGSPGKRSEDEEDQKAKGRGASAKSKEAASPSDFNESTSDRPKNERSGRHFIFTEGRKEKSGT